MFNKLTIRKPKFVSDILQFLLKNYSKEESFFVISKRVSNLYPNVMTTLKDEGFAVIEFKDGEGVKNYKNKVELESILLKNHIRRNSILLVIGGGTLSDLCGFVASTLFRGIEWVIVPTTLLSMVDAAIGGKTAINNSFGKNLIGSFHFPKDVLVDTAFLKTLPKKEFKNGITECIKYGIIQDNELFYDCLKLSNNDEKLLTQIIKKSQEIKLNIVSKDPFEKRKERLILNFGHSVAHSVEKSINYKISHGLAVSYGIVFESCLSYLDGFLKEEVYEEISDSLKRINPYHNLELSYEKIVENLSFDKKNINSKSFYIPIRKIGEVALKRNFLKEIDYEKFKRAYFIVK